MPKDGRDAQHFPQHSPESSIESSKQYDWKSYSLIPCPVHGRSGAAGGLRMRDRDHDGMMGRLRIDDQVQVSKDARRPGAGSGS